MLMLILNWRSQYFQIAFKMSCKNNHSDMVQKLKEITDAIKKIELEKNIHINKPYKA